MIDLDLREDITLNRTFDRLVALQGGKTVSRQVSNMP
jgi:hypothetical protein